MIWLNDLVILMAWIVSYIIYMLSWSNYTGDSRVFCISTTLVIHESSVLEQIYLLSWARISGKVVHKACIYNRRFWGSHFWGLLNHIHLCLFSLVLSSIFLVQSNSIFHFFRFIFWVKMRSFLLLTPIIMNLSYKSQQLSS